MVTLKDVALLAQVSIATASYALNHSQAGKLTLRTRLRVEAAAKALDYHPNLAGRLLQGAPSKTIGLIACQHTVSLFTEFLHLISKQLYALGYKTVYRMLELKDDSGDLETEAADELVAAGVDGIIIGYLDEFPSFPRSRCKVPIVQLDGRTPDVAVDLQTGGYLAARHLIQHGHQKIAYLKSDSKYNQRKLKGYVQALREAGLCPTPDTILNLQESLSWEDSIARLMHHEKITAICCQNDEYAAIILNYLRTKGVRIPEDIALFGFDGLGFVDWLPVSLSTVVQPLTTLVDTLCQTMIDKIRTHSLDVLPSPRLLTPDLHLARSCGCPDPQIIPAGWKAKYPHIP